jgi:hypothetical protein
MAYRWPCGCPDRGLSGQNECHCGSCRRHFTGPAAFDAHWQTVGDDRRCVDPATLTHGPNHAKAGQPLLRVHDRASGPVWGSAEERPEGTFPRRPQDSERLSGLPGIPATPNGSHPRGERG